MNKKILFFVEKITILLVSLGILFLLFFKQTDNKIILWAPIIISIVIILILSIVLLRKHTPAIRIPRIPIGIFWNDKIKRVLKWIIIIGSITLIWWYWYLIIDYQIPLPQRPGKKIIPIKKNIAPVKNIKEAREKIWQLKWEKNTDTNIHIPQNTFKIEFTKINEKEMEFILSDYNKICLDNIYNYKLSSTNAPSRESYGTFNGRQVYVGEETWKWTGSYKNQRTGIGGKIFMNERCKKGEIEYFGRVSRTPT